MAPQVLLSLRAVRKTFDGVVANDDVSFDVPRGARVGLIGPNGSGKTTLFNSIAGQHPVDSGSITLAGRDLAPLDAAEIARLGLARTWQQAHVYESLTCLQNLLVSVAHRRERWRAMFARPDAHAVERGERLLEFVELAAQRDRVAGELSYGQRKLLELAMALMAAPCVLLADEPTAGVNPALIDRLVERLRRANEELGITLLIIEHNMRVVMDLAEQVHCLAHGRLLASGTPEAVRGDARVLEAYLGTR